MKLAGAFGRADWVRSQLYYTTLSLDLHDQNPAGLDLDRITRQLYQSLQPWTWLEGNRMYASFGHLTGYSSNYYTYVGAHLEGRYRVPVAVGNDGNLGTLGEIWLGSARQARSALGMCIGTGIGAGFVQNGKLWRGARESAGEIGHIVMQIGGPKCGCGNHGCLEALASRTAIERNIRGRGGRPPEHLGRIDRRQSERHSQRPYTALEAEDPLVTEIDPPCGRSAGPRLPHGPPSDRPRSHRAGRRSDRGV